MIWQKCQILVPSPIAHPSSIIAVSCAKKGVLEWIDISEGFLFYKVSITGKAIY
jgi:hypothetical protein